jgi:hypothetical protein
MFWPTKAIIRGIYLLLLEVCDNIVAKAACTGVTSQEKEYYDIEQDTYNQIIRIVICEVTDFN